MVRLVILPNWQTIYTCTSPPDTPITRMAFKTKDILLFYFPNYLRFMQLGSTVNYPILCYSDSSYYLTVPCYSEHLDKSTTIDTSNYNENLRIFLRIVESDTWKYTLIGQLDLSPSNIDRKLLSKTNQSKQKFIIIFTITIWHTATGRENSPELGSEGRASGEVG